MLAVKGLTKKFGGLIAVNNLSFEANAGILSILGPNGSGKTTLLNCISGLYKSESGVIYLDDQPIHTLKPHERARLGMGRTFQVPRIFEDLTLVQNMLVPVLHLKEDLNALQAKALQLLRYVNLYHLRDHLGRELSGGQQKLLELARALMFDVRLLLLDEPFAGVHPEIKKILMDRILELRREGKTIILVSHDMVSVRTLSDRVMVLHNGEKIAEGTFEEVRHDRAVIQAYLGD
jgi:branched-chain amino acid transport system ATP-binding protein